MSRLTVPLLMLLLEAPLFAQAPAAPKALKLGTVTFSGNVRTRIEAWDWFSGDANNSYAFSGSTFRFSFGQQKPRFDWQFEIAAPVLLGLPDDAIAAGTQGQLGLGATYFAANSRRRSAALPFVRQGFIRLKSLMGKDAHSLRLGRMEFVDGTEVTPKDATLSALKRDRVSHRLLGNFAFSHVGRTYDGMHYAYNKGRNNVTLWGARPTRGVFQTDGWGELNIAVGYAAFTRQAGSGRNVGEMRLFGLYYDDWRKNVLKTDNRPLAPRRADGTGIRIATVGGHYLHAAATGAGTWDAMLWGAFQAGSWGVQDHRAGAISAEAGYQPHAWPRLKPWFRSGFHYGSGDPDPDDGQHNTFFQMLPTPRLAARFPFYNLMNNQDAFIEALLRPGPRLTLRGDVHWLRLASRNDLWYLGGGAFQPWTFGFTGRASGGQDGMATVADLSADVQISPRVALGLYFADARGGSVISGIYPKGDSARLGYVELVFRF